MILLDWQDIKPVHLSKYGQVVIGVASLSKESHMQYRDVLSKEEISFADQLRIKKIADRKKTTRTILRLLLGRMLNINPAAIRFSISSFQKPELSADQAPGLSFNVSHSKDLLLIAMGKGVEVGVDVEWIDNSINFPVMLPLVLTPEEQICLDKSSNRLNLFYTLWTSKEAILKAVGCGLSIPPTRLNLPVRNRINSVISIPEEISGGKICTLQTAEPLQGYTAAMAVLSTK